MFNRVIRIGLLVSIAITIITGYGGMCGGSGGETSDSGSSAPITNRVPVLTAIGNKTITEGVTLSFTVSATDPDGDTITYSAYNAPAGASFTAATRTFSWTPTYNQAGTYTVSFRVTDSTYLYSEEAITITVDDVSAPNAPTDLIASVISTTQIDIRWSDNSSNESGFKIERKIGSGGTYTQLNTAGTDVIYYSDTGLSGSTQYYYRVRAYGPTGNSTYSNEVSAATTSLNVAPTVINNYITNLTDIRASFYGALNPNGSATTTYFQWGATTAYGNNTTSQSLGNSTTSVNVSADITGLSPNTTYHFRLAATNSIGTSYGQDQTFTTSAQAILPSATTGAALNITYNSVSLTGTANPNGYAGSAYFQWGTSTAYGGVTTPQSIGAVTSSVNANGDIIGIGANTTYHFRLVVDNVFGSVFGSDQTFSTVAGPPTATTNPATNVQVNTVTLNAAVNPNGLDTTAYFQWGVMTTYGNSTIPKSIGSGTNNVNAAENVTGLTTNTSYNFRVVATNSSGTVYGLNQAFVTLSSTVSETDWAMIMGGEFHTLAVKNDGTLWAWGENSHGELGVGDSVSRTIPTQVGAETNWSKVAVGSGYSIGLKNNGTLWAWGDNLEGQLGLGSSVTGTNAPTRVGTRTDWTSIGAGGHSHTVARTSGGAMYAWGDNSVGQLGLGDTTTKFDPIQVGTDNTWTSVSCGYDHTIATKVDGTLWSWGSNSTGQLGLGDTTMRTAPVKIVTDTGWSSVAGGYGHTVATKNDGSLWGWGANTEGQLGLGSLPVTTTPALISNTGWSNIAIGYNHTTAQKSDGTIWAWGANADGQLGLGDIISRTAPTLVVTDTDWAKIYPGWNHSIGVRSDSSLWGWGANSKSQLGVVDSSNKNKPNSTFGGIGWVKYPSNPVFNIGSPSSWDDYSVSEPCVIKESNGTYKMWYSGYDGTTWRIGYATSGDGITWTKYLYNPVLNVGSAGAWDDYNVVYQTVLKDSDGIYKIWYSGMDALYSFKGIGYATSPDGVNWTKYASNPVIIPGTNSTWDDTYVGCPTVIKESGTYKMWYWGCDGSSWSGGLATSKWKIGYATSTDGISWTKYSTPVLDGGTQYVNVTDPCVIKDSDGTYKMWYNGENLSYNSSRTCYAFSSDGINWTKYPIDLDLFSSWESAHVAKPNVIKDSNGKFKMWYEGVDANNGRVGYATSR